MLTVNSASLQGFHVFERGWLSSNNVLFTDGERSLLVDSGYCSHAVQTLQLVQRVLGNRPLDCLVNTHLHSDHCGGNALFQAQYPHLQTLIPPGQANLVSRWDPIALTYLPTGQSCPQYSFNDVLQPGAEVRFGERLWQVHAAAGHDPHSLLFFDPVEKVLISADALWENGFGVVFPELEGEDAFSQVAATFDLIEKLKPVTVIPGHGTVFSYSAAVLARARARLDYFVRSPTKHARHAAKVLIKFKLLEAQQITVTDLAQWVLHTSYLMNIRASFFKAEPQNEWVNSLLAELAVSGAVKRTDDSLLNV